jgi:hypothetical protein
MWKDPIVEEIHKIREEIAKENNYDLDTLIRSLQEREKQHKERTVSREGTRKTRSGTT